MMEFRSDDWSEVSIRRLLESQVTLLRKSPQDFVVPVARPGTTDCDLDIAASYWINGQNYNDLEFFDKLVTQGIPVANLLRELYFAYYANPNAPRNLARWDGNLITMSSLGQVVRAAALLDFNQSDLIGAHFKNRDMECDTYTPYVLLRDYADKYQWSSETAQRLGLRWCTAAWMDNPGANFWQYGLARAAEKIMTASRFFEIFLQEFHDLGCKLPDDAYGIGLCFDVLVGDNVMMDKWGLRRASREAQLRMHIGDNVMMDKWGLPSDLPNEFDKAVLEEALRVCPELQDIYFDNDILSWIDQAQRMPR